MFKCDICGDEKANKYLLRQHKLWKHEGGRISPKYGPKAKFTKAVMEELYIKQLLPLMSVACQLGVRYQVVTYWMAKWGIPIRSHKEAQTLAIQQGRWLKKMGVANGSWTGGKIKTWAGYIKIRCPEHPRADTGYVWEHVLVWESAHGPLPEGWIIHHLNGIKDDNRLENLLAMPRKQHQSAYFPQMLQKRIRELEAKLEAAMSQLPLMGTAQ